MNKNIIFHMKTKKNKKINVNKRELFNLEDER